jgi:hypothetical protein
MHDLDARLAALEAVGWKLVSSRDALWLELPDGTRVMQAPGNFTLEKAWRGRPLREFSETSLAECLERAEWQENRISKLDNTNPRVHTGLQGA